MGCGFALALEHRSEGRRDPANDRFRHYLTFSGMAQTGRIVPQPGDRDRQLSTSFDYPRVQTSLRLDAKLPFRVEILFVAHDAACGGFVYSVQLIDIWDCTSR